MEISAVLESLIIKIAVLILLGFSLFQGQKTVTAVVSNIKQFGDQPQPKENVVAKALFNFWIGFAAVLIIVSGIFELLSREVFIVFLGAVLGGLGLKLTKEFEDTRRK